MSQYLKEPRTVHFKVVIHLLRYIKGSLHIGIFINDSTDFTLTAYTDSDWGACLDTRRSVTGFLIYLGGCLVSWKSKKQTVVSLSSAEAEYRVVSKGTAELVWLKRILDEFSVEVSLPVTLYTDSQAALLLAKNPVHHERTKHIELDCHFVRDKVLDGFINLVHISTNEQLADMLTKVLTGPIHFNLIAKLGVLVPSLVNLRGC